MTLDKRKSKLIVFCIIGAIGFFLLGFFADKLNPGKQREPLVEQKPYQEVFEIKGFEAAEIYNSENKFVGAEIKIKIDLTSSFEEIPDKYRKREVPLYVRNITSLKKLASMKEALENNKYIKMVNHVNAAYEDIKIKNKVKFKIIKEINLEPKDYVFLKY